MSMPELRQTETFQTWREALKDTKLRALIASRLDRLAFGHIGDAKQLGDGINELRIHYGPGYRMYFSRRGDAVIVLLCGGEKRSQSRDIAAARRIMKEWTDD